MLLSKHALPVFCVIVLVFKMVNLSAVGMVIHLGMFRNVKLFYGCSLKHVKILWYSAPAITIRIVCGLLNMHRIDVMKRKRDKRTRYRLFLWNCFCIHLTNGAIAPFDILTSEICILIELTHN